MSYNLITSTGNGYISDVEGDVDLRQSNPRRSNGGRGYVSPEPIETQASASQQSMSRSQSAPLSQHRKIGDKYEVVLEKNNNSLGLNVTVRFHWSIVKFQG